MMHERPSAHLRAAHPRDPVFREISYTGLRYQESHPKLECGGRVADTSETHMGYRAPFVLT
jgi:hypothetical protein